MLRRGLPARAGRWLALAFVWLLPLGLLEGGLALAGWGDATELFLPSEGDPAFLSLNPQFVAPYFPPGLSRLLKPAYVRRHKTPSTYRIFVLGESAAAGFPDHTTGFARRLRVLLRLAFPELDVELTNLATAAINSHVAADIARRCADLEPDLLLVYMGNNEVIGPFGPTAELTPPASDVRLVRAIAAIRRLRVSQWLADLRGRASPPAWRGMQPFADHPFPHGDPRLEVVYAAFRSNLEEIRRVALAAGARLVLSRVITNLSDFAPFLSVPRSDLEPAERGEWERLFRRGSAELRKGQARRALELLLAAERIDAEPAELAFARGRAHLALGDEKAAREQLTRALDLDALRFRADSRINAIIEEVAVDGGTDRVEYVDPSDIAVGGVPGGDLFLEHVHFSAAGNQAMAERLFQGVAAAIAADTGQAPRPVALGPQELAEVLFDAPPFGARALRLVGRMVSRPPFTLRRGNDLLVRDLLDRADRIEATPFRVSGAVIDALRADPDDHAIHHKAFEYLKRELAESRRTGKATKARELMHAVETVLAIRGENGDLNRLREQWSAELTPFRELEAPPRRG